MTYTSLNDGAQYVPCLSPGAVEIWYMRRDWFGRGINGEWPDPKWLARTHIHLGSVSGTDLDELFRSLQGEEWSPEGEANELIVGLGLGHTSMSVGDVIVIGDKIMVVANMGFDFVGDRLM